MTKPHAQNSGKTGMPRGRPFKPGQSGNPGGRPKNTQSITYWLNEFGNMTPAALAKDMAQYAVQLKKVKGDMPMFAHIAIRALMSQINEPTPGLLAQILERTEGKVKDSLELTGLEGGPVAVSIIEVIKDYSKRD